MASIEHRNVSHIEESRQSDEKADSGSPIDEKSPSVEVATDEASLDVRDGDEALELVGMRRTGQFSEEYFLKLRGKLVCLFAVSYVFRGVLLKSFKCIGLDYPTPLCGSVLYAVSVSMNALLCDTEGINE